MNISETQLGESMTYGNYVDVNKNNKSDVIEERFLYLGGKIIASYIDNNHALVNRCSSAFEDCLVIPMFINKCKETGIKLIYIETYDNNKFIKITERLEHMVKVFKDKNILGDYI